MSGCRRGWLMVLLLGFTAPAFGQNTAVDVAASHSFLTEPHTGGNFQAWSASIAGNTNPVLGVAGEVGGSYDVKLWWVLGGLRFTSRKDRRVTPYAQVLLGVDRVRRTYFVLQPGGGADFWHGPRFGVRVGGDYHQLFTGRDEPAEFLRFHIGVVVRSAAR